MAAPTVEELRKMTPQERAKRLKELEEERKKQLADRQKTIEERKKQLEEETKALQAQEKQSEEEIAATEDAVKETEEEDDEEERDDGKKQEKRKKEAEEQDLESRVGSQPAAKPEDQQPLYQTSPTNVYGRLEQAAKRLDQLYAKTQWTSDDQKVYTESKEEIERAQTYQMKSPGLEVELSFAQNMLERLKYKR